MIDEYHVHPWRGSSVADAPAAIATLALALTRLEAVGDRGCLSIAQLYDRMRTQLGTDADGDADDGTRFARLAASARALAEETHACFRSVAGGVQASRPLHSAFRAHPSHICTATGLTPPTSTGAWVDRSSHPLS